MIQFNDYTVFCDEYLSIIERQGNYSLQLIRNSKQNTAIADENVRLGLWLYVLNKEKCEQKQVKFQLTLKNCDVDSFFLSSSGEIISLKTKRINLSLYS